MHALHILQPLVNGMTVTVRLHSDLAALHLLILLLLFQVTENRLIGLLEQVNEQSSTKTKVTIQRRRALDDDY